MTATASCHPGRPIKGKGLCGSCYNAQRRATVTTFGGKKAWACAHTNRPNHAHGRCASCTALHAKSANPERARDYQLRSDYGITLAEYNRRLRDQLGLCAVCRGLETVVHGKGAVPDRLAVDHRHLTDFTRGLLCGKCNKGIGLLDDDPARLRSAADYIEAWLLAESVEVLASLVGEGEWLA